MSFYLILESPQHSEALVNEYSIDRENLQTKLLEKKPSRFGKQKDANNKEVQEKAQIKNMEIFVQR